MRKTIHQICGWFFTFNFNSLSFKKGEFPGSPVVRTPCFHCSRAEVFLFPGWGTKIPQAKDKKGNHSFAINKHVFHKSIDMKLHVNRMKEKNHMIISIGKGFPERSVGKEYACNAGDPNLIPRSGRSDGEEIGYPRHYSCPVHFPLQEFPCGSARKESTCNAGDQGSIPGLGRSPGEGKGHPLQYSGLENFMNRTVHGVAKSWTQLSDFHFQ